MNTKGIFIDIPVELYWPRVYPSKASLPLAIEEPSPVESPKTLPLIPPPPGAARPAGPPYKRAHRTKTCAMRRRKGLSALLQTSIIHVVHLNDEALRTSEPAWIVQDWPQSVAE